MFVMLRSLPFSSLSLLEEEEEEEEEPSQGSVDGRGPCPSADFNSTLGQVIAHDYCVMIPRKHRA